MVPEAKAHLAHREWIPWVKRNFALSVKTVKDYMAFARQLKPGEPEGSRHHGGPT